ncbi:MAG: VOC family protein [Nitrospirota bacterium]|jgi:catechol 2,3-dioxygenase-like lactoylglutathione lyase family enzyme
MLDHIGLKVRDVPASKAFYTQALAPLGYTVMMEWEGGVGLAAAGKPDFWLGQGEPTGGVHVAFSSPDRKTVDAFHRAALAAGGKDNGAPGLRPHYHSNYYGAFVFDPDGNNIEAVCHATEG